MTDRPIRPRWRRAGRWILIALTATAVVVLAGGLGIRAVAGDAYTPPPGAPDVVARPPVHDPSRPTVAVLVDRSGTNVADSLAPYEVFARTGALNVYTVAADAGPVPLTGGLDLLPDLTFEQLARLDPDGPDVVVVPQLTAPDARVMDWIKARHAGGSLLLSVCVGAGLLAQAGLLDGRPATSNWLGLIGLRRDHPQVRWTDGVRFVDDGQIITSAAVLSGIDGSLRVVERLLGPAAATRVAGEIHWAGYAGGGGDRIPSAGPAPADVVGLLSAGFRWDRPSTAVLLTDGVGEIELAAAFRPTTELSFLATPLAASVHGQPVRSRLGLTFLPRFDWPTAVAAADRVVVPGVDAARDQVAAGLPRPSGTSVVYLNRSGEFAFDGALRDIAAGYDVATAEWVGKTLQYPTEALGLTGPRWPWELTARPLLIAAAAVLLLAFLRFPRRPPTRSGSTTREASS